MVGLLDNFTTNSSLKPSHGVLSTSVLRKSYGILTSTSYREDILNTANFPDASKVLFNLVNGLHALLNAPSKIICMSVGVKQSLNFALRNILKKYSGDIQMITPSGNKGNGTVLSPGIHPEVFCVGAADKNGKVAPFSGRIYDEDGNCLKPEVCALGVDVEVELEDGSKHVVNGTSFACAQVAGVAAALFEANPEATINDVKMALIESCTPAEGSRFGNINPEKALELIKTKVPYEEQFQPIPEPEWLDEQYIDYRLISQCKRARRNNKDVEGLVVGEDTDALIKRLEEEMGDYLSEYHPFKNFDMAHIIAKPEFYDALFEQPDLEVASAVDINYFDM